MSEKERLQLENELLMTCSKAQAINKYIDELEENSKLSELWCKSQQENQQLKEKEELHLNRIDELTNRVVDLKEVIEEVKEVIRDSHVEVLKYHDEPSETTSYEIVTVELLQILDKAKEVNKCET